jgi:hypothetical protein
MPFGRSVDRISELKEGRKGNRWLAKLIFWIVVTIKSAVFNNKKMNSAGGL